MENRLTDNFTGFLRELAAKVAYADGKAEAEETIARAADLIRERMNEERIEAAGRLAGWLAHKINNPLGAISGNAQLLGRRLQRDMSEGEALEAYLRYVESIQAQTERCAKITGEILAFTRARELEIRSVDVREVISEAVELACYGRTRSDISVTCGELPRVHTDRELLQKALYEVIVNAIIAADGGKADVETAQEDGFICVKVSDSGPGIPAEAVQRVFEPFFSTRDKAKGLGLTTALSSMSQLGGTVEIVRTGEDGTVFAVRIPVERQ